MRDVILTFINELRHAGLRISLSESMDAMQAMAVAGIEQAILREALAASVVKDEEDRPVFDEIFARFFARPHGRKKGKQEKRLGGGEGQRVKESGAPPHTHEQPPEKKQTSERPAAERKKQPEPQESRLVAEKPPEREGRTASNADDEQQQQQRQHATNLALRRAMLEKPFKEFDARDVESSQEIVEELAKRLRSRFSRRYRRGSHGRLDFRRTFRASVARGGIPIELFWRYRRPGKSDLVALCDISGSVALVSDFLLALIAPASGYFRHVRTFAYVDRCCEVSFENGYVTPHETLDLYARSDFGKVLQQFWKDEGERILTRNTVMLILGDARNNRRPPRADLLTRIRDRAKKLIWLNPEPHERWNTGDSVMGQYTSACDVVLSCSNLKDLLGGLKQLL